MGPLSSLYRPFSVAVDSRSVCTDCPYQKSRNIGTPGESQHGIRAVHALIDRRALQVSAVHISRVLSAASSSSIFDTTIPPLSFFDTFLLSTFHYDYGRPQCHAPAQAGPDLD